MSRSASIERNTSETKIKLSINLDGNGNGNIHTGIGFFDHMLNALSASDCFIAETDGFAVSDLFHAFEETTGYFLCRCLHSV